MSAVCGLHRLELSQQGFGHVGVAAGLSYLRYHFGLASYVSFTLTNMAGDHRQFVFIVHCATIAVQPASSIATKSLVVRSTAVNPRGRHTRFA